MGAIKSKLSPDSVKYSKVKITANEFVPENTSKYVIEIHGIDQDGFGITRCIKLPSLHDWEINLTYTNRKIVKYFNLENCTYDLYINKVVIKHDDNEQWESIMTNITSVSATNIYIGIVNQVTDMNGDHNNDIETAGDYRMIIVHYGNDEFRFKVGQDLSTLDEEAYDELLDETKKYFKIKGRMRKLYEDVGGKKIFVDDWDDLSEHLEEYEDGEPLHLHLEHKNKGKGKGKVSLNNKSIQKTKSFQLGQSKIQKKAKTIDMNDELYIWCNNNGFAKYCIRLRDEFEINKPIDFNLLETNDLETICNQLSFGMVTKKKFMIAIQALNNTSEKKLQKQPQIMQAREEKQQYRPMNPNDPLFLWCKANELETYYDKLINEIKIKSPRDLVAFSDKDLDEICAALGIRFGEKIQFKRAVQQLKASKNKPRFVSDDLKEGYDDISAKKPRPVRNLPPGFSLVPHKKMQYQAPSKQKFSYGRRSNKSQSLSAQVISTFQKAWISFTSSNPSAAYVPQQKMASSATDSRIVSTSNNKTIMMVGKTGVGKTTLINSMMNYIYDVRLDDPYRFKLIEEKPKDLGQSQSQTDHVTVYQIKRPKGGNISYGLTIVDTPGFADTRGPDKDAQITADIKYFFETHLDSIDGVCFIIKASDNRVDAVTKYVFNKVLNLWAKNIEENIFVLLTFSDGDDPPVMDSLEQHKILSKCSVFKLNNSAYKKDPTKKSKLKHSSKMNQMFWNMGEECFAEFFAALNKVTSKSINESRQVLRQRENITIKVQNISNDVDILLHKTQEMSDQERFIRVHQKEINANQKVTKPVNEYYWDKEYQSNNVITQCRVCKNQICHPSCCVSDKRDCASMNDDGRCTVCPGKCHYSDHSNCNYIYVKKKKTVFKSNWDDSSSIKGAYNAAISKKTKSERILVNLKRKKVDLETEIQHKIGEIIRLRNFLERVALRPSLTTVGDYIDQMIDAENQSETKDPERITLLNKYKKHEYYIAQIAKANAADDVELSKFTKYKTRKI
eukprot:501033_1